MRHLAEVLATTNQEEIDMSRHKATGEKATATKPERQHAKAVDREIADPSPANTAKTNATFNHLHKTSERYSHRNGY